MARRVPLLSLDMADGDREDILTLAEGLGVVAGNDFKLAWQRIALPLGKVDRVVSAKS